jgi:RNA recognition motif-containing protein
MMISQCADAIHMNNVGGHASDMCNLYVNDLPPGADDLWMYRTFSPYGAISSVRVMKDESGLSRGFGFVMFVLVQDAVNAIEAVNGKLVTS